VDATGISEFQSMASLGGPDVCGDVGRTGQVANANFPQPFYQTVAYGPAFPSDSCTPYGSVSDLHQPRVAPALYPLNTDRIASIEVSDSVRY
jgi:hypothetical protein